MAKHATGLSPHERADDENSARRADERRVALSGVVLAFVAGVGIWLFPKVFGDESAARVVVVATILGGAAIGFAVDVVQRLRTEAAQRPPQVISAHYAIWARGLTESGTAASEARPTKTPLRLSRVDLRKAALANTDLRQADLRFADLREADLRSADLREADLRGANLRRADLRRARLANAVYDDRTAWPTDMDFSEPAGAIDVDTDK